MHEAQWANTLPNSIVASQYHLLQYLRTFGLHHILVFPLCHGADTLTENEGDKTVQNQGTETEQFNIIKTAA